MSNWYPLQNSYLNYMVYEKINFNYFVFNYKMYKFIVLSMNKNVLVEMGAELTFSYSCSNSSVRH